MLVELELLAPVPLALLEVESVPVDAPEIAPEPDAEPETEPEPLTLVLLVLGVAEELVA